jgi:aminoglycoside N3'-acetyltransferase
MTLKAGQVTRVDYEEIDHCCQKFSLLDQWLESQSAQRRGIVGYAEARLARSRQIVNTAVQHLAQDETVFLHPPGVCAECDAARANAIG